MALAAAGLLAAGAAQAQEGCRARLVLENGAATEGCPDARAVRSAVAGRLGYDPFCEGADARLHVIVERRARAFVGEIELRDRAGRRHGHRRISGDYARCEPLASALTLAISIAIDPLGAARPPRAAAPRPEPAPVPPPPGRPFALELAAGGGVAVGTLPRPTPAVALGGRVLWSRYAVGLEARRDLPVTSAASSGTARTSLDQLSLLSCLRGTWASACALLSAGLVQAEGRGLLAHARRSTGTTSSVGLRGELGLPLWSALRLRLVATASTPLIRTRVTVGAEDAWRSPRVAVAVVSQVGWRW